ncbi:MAG: hypothetical protein AAFX39_12975 [Pseudomonadota bacterium]
MSSVWDIILVGKTPLGSALRGALIGAVMVFLAGWFTRGLTAFFLGVVIAVIVIPLIYLVSHRDDGRAVWHDPTSSDDWSSDDRRIH